jgi:hypothetical protein
MFGDRGWRANGLWPSADRPQQRILAQAGGGADGGSGQVAPRWAKPARLNRALASASWAWASRATCRVTSNTTCLAWSVRDRMA